MAAVDGKKSALRSKLKITVIVVAAVLAGAILALPFLLDVDQFRPQLETRLSETLGRSVKLGKLRLSLFSGGFSVADISIADNPKFSDSPFVTAGAFNIGVELKPLIFSRQIHITGISLDKPSIHLRRSAGGEWNFSDLGSKEGGAGKEDGAAKTGEPHAPAEPSDILIDRLQVTGGRVEIVEGEKPPTVYEKVNLTVRNFAPAATSPFTLSAALPGGGVLGMDGVFGPTNHGDMLQTPLDANLEIKGFDLVASGYVPTGAGLAGTIDFNGNLASDGKVAQSKGKATASNLQLVKGGSSAAKPVSLDYDLGYDLKKKTGTLSEASVAFGSAAMLVSGDFDAGGDTPRLKMKLEGNAIPVEELQELLPALGITLPNGASLEGGTLDTEIAAEGTLDDLAMDGTVAITGTRLTGFNLGEKMAVAAKAAGLKSSPDTLIEKLGAGMRWTSQGIAISDIQFVMPSLGSLSGAGTISPQQELDFTMRATVQPSGGELAALTKGKTLRVSFFVRGNATDPKFIPDYKDAARGLLDGFLSGQGSTEGATGGTTGKGDTLKDSLRGLFKRR